MNASSGGGSSNKSNKRYMAMRNKQRANMSFFIVVMFFAVFGIIVFTEIFLIDERGRSAGVLVRHGSLTYHQRQQDREYDDVVQNDDYISIRLNNNGRNLGEDTIGDVLLGRRPAPLHARPDLSLNEREILTEAQLPAFANTTVPLDGVWQTVNGTRYKFYVFSAFFDNRKGQRAIRIIGATKTRGPERVWCRLWYKSGDINSTIYNSKTVVAKIKIIRENWNLKYSACFVMCPIHRNQTVPMYVSIVSKVKYPPSNYLIVVNNFNQSFTTRYDKDRPKKFAICVKPLHFDYNRFLQILEFIELNRIMGVEHFTFYNHTVGQQVECILKDYVRQGLVSLLPWQLNMVSQKEIRTEGLFAALNDCLYRNMYRYTHVLLIDLDEYIIPRHNDTLPQLVQYLSGRINSRSTGSFSFQNAFFYLQWGDGDFVYESHDTIAASLVTLKKVRRKSKLHPHKQRSKYICRPELIVEAGNHFIWEYIPGHGTFNVPADSAILHHYRICEFGGDDCINTASLMDTTAYRYKEALIANVKDRFHKYKIMCRLSEPPPPPERGFEKLMKIFKSDAFKTS